MVAPLRSVQPAPRHQCPRGEKDALDELVGRDVVEEVVRHPSPGAEGGDDQDRYPEAETDGSEHVVPVRRRPASGVRGVGGRDVLTVEVTAPPEPRPADRPGR